MFRLLVLVLVAALPLRPALAACPSESSHSNRVVVHEGDLRFVLGTDAGSYAQGAPVSMVLGVENLGSATATIPNPWALTPMNAWYVYPAPCALPIQDCLDFQSVFHWPGFFFYFGGPVNVAPGDCYEVSLTWDGLDDGQVVAEGEYFLHAGYLGGSGPTGLHYPAGGVRMPITITNAVPAIPVTWGGIKVTFR